MDKQNTTPPDMIAQAGALLKMLQDGDPIGNVGCLGDDPDSDDRAIVIASAVLAVAGELRELRNVLAMAMEPGTDEAGDPTAALRTVSLK
jgi:hypothetical protein